ncbi:DUF262 domain-containing protein [Blautia sp.]|uniref:DUF262 domain-containing protein n=1 Tax=Blautia sp. TaxID=1955243 RepID=UPI002584DAFD|nr:DUF262 domain-containing protein [Blautia sp.]
MSAKSMISEDQKIAAEEQIRSLRKEIDYNTRDYSIDFLIQQFRDDEFYIPDEYQRQYIWNNADKNRFVESILLGLPIPLMFFSDTEDGRCEIIDGAQRTQAMEEFMSGDLVLSDLKKLTSLNGFSYNDIPAYFRKKFDKTNMRIIVLSDDTTLEIRQEIFNRINTTGRGANSSEIRRGSFRGPFMDFLMECTKDDVFKAVCPISETMKKRYEQLELVIRFFAFVDHYQEFTHRVDNFLDEYIEHTQSSFNKDEMKAEFDRMLEFVKTYFPYGFAKSERAKSTPRVRFEAISVGVALALREKPDLIPNSMDWLNSNDFKRHTTTHASNSPARVSGRILYVKDQLLKGTV